MKRLLALLLAGASLAASAHVVLETQSAEAGGYYKGVLRVSHGCNGSPTTGIRLIVPEGVLRAHPMPKAGWKLAIKKAPLKTPIDNHGKVQTDDVGEVAWSGGTLPDAFYDEFVFSAKLPATPGATLAFQVEQTCAKGGMRWFAVPAEGQDAHALKEPAALLKLTAPGNAHPH
ncbi:YcnI family protein [Crenobacter cavernae]|uniref:DUF1775 domain-containing protein n=1 Tax=Crenobacter cavernae TaxID=2290923 RepID=A0ABY0FDC2_9NEIS|nr:YcnI family protein [Crenobacter cavernae]RXZ43969.1 DUF1775 domain-containing protein [Crenobacter cavernae]